MSCVYLARNIVNSKGYVGFAFDLERRKQGHARSAEDGSLLVFHCAIRKYGWDAFEWSILFEDDDNDREWLGWWEKKFIRELKTKVPNGYNMTDGGDGGAMPISDSTRKKLSEGITRYWSDERNRRKLSFILSGIPKPAGFSERLREVNLGKRHTEATKKKMSDAKKGTHRVFTEEHKRNISKSAKKRGMPRATIEKGLAASAVSPNRGMTGKKHSEESKRKMSESAKRWRRRKRENLKKKEQE